MACNSFSFPVLSNTTLGQQLTQTFSRSFDVKVDDSTLLSDSFLWMLYCAADTAQVCHGICPNADLAGVGVRAAFWISSILQAILVALSPEESTQGSWTAAILTASVTIPAFIQKRNRQLSVYHATLVLNFATFSSIVSLAVAPMCSVWRENPSEEEQIFDLYAPAENPTPDITSGEEGQTTEEMPMSNLPRRKVHRQRLVLSLALLTQVALQWTWTVMLFTDPEYYQKACIPNTTVVLFGKPFTASSINHGLYLIWPMWLLFNLAITLIWGILLVHSSSPLVHPVLSRSSSRLDLPLTWRDKVPLDKGRIMVLFANAMAFLISILFLVSSEVQVVKNCVHDENSDWSFGQIAALLVALAPAWSIVTALERRQRSQKADPDARHHDSENPVYDHSGTVSVLATSDGSKTPFEHSVEVLQERTSITVEATYTYSSSLMVPHDVVRPRTVHKPPPTP